MTRLFVKPLVVLKLEDITMDPLVGVEKSVELLKQSILHTFNDKKEDM